LVASTTLRSFPAASRRAVRLAVKMLPILVLVSGIALSWYLANVMRGEIERTAEERFVHQIDLVKKRVVERLAHLTLISELGLGMVQIVNNTNPEQWTSFTNGLDRKALTGLVGIGYAERAKPYAGSLLSRLYSYSPDIGIESLGDPQADRIYPVTLFEPASAAPNFLGLDLASDRRLRQAADRAMTSGKTTLSKVMTKEVGDIAGSAFVLAPVYTPNTAPKTTDERRTRLVGWVVLPVQFDQLVNEAVAETANMVDIQVYMGAATPENLLYGTATPAPVAPIY